MIRVYNLENSVILVPFKNPTESIEIEKIPPFLIKPFNQDLVALDQHCDGKTEKLEAFGLVGMIRLICGPYLILITGRKHVGSLRGQDIWKLTTTSIIGLGRNGLLTPRQRQDEEAYLSMINSVLSEDFYFSETLHLTHSLQRLSTQKDWSGPLHKKADPRFFWNAHLMKPFIEAGQDSWVLPTMMGFVKVETVDINGRRFDFVLISRRNVNRAGTRYTRRGSDSRGEVANNVETEQLIIYEDEVFSFVQTRGSVPVVWRQNPNLKYAPPIKLSPSSTTCFNAFQAHFRKQMEKYGKQVVVSLVDQKGRELALSQSYMNNGKTFNDSNPPERQIKQFHFDFHHECKGMKYENLNKLLEQASTYIDEFGWFDKERLQTGVVRTNCVDNLDRTNVVQAMFAQYVLNKQLQKLGILNGGETISNHEGFLYIFKNVWADNADAISTQYSGTGALKNDYTRTGKRNLNGLINDGINSVTRYFLNNFNDGFRQDSYDLFLGNYQVAERQTESPLIKKDQERNFLYFVVLSVGSLMLAASLFSPSDLGYTGKFLALLMWGATFFGLYKVALHYGDQIVDRPCLADDSMDQ